MEETCIFCKIIQKQLPATILLDDPELIVIEDIKPRAPSHFLIIPKQHIATINNTENQDQQLLGYMILTAKKIAQLKALNDFGYRLVFNVNPGGGQDVYNIHLHLLGGRQMTGPPG